MALVECKECGSRVSDGAVTCPSCGVAGPAGAGKLLVTRQKQLMGGFFPVSVAVDGVGHGRLMPGGQMELELAPGRHEVVLGFPKGDVSDK